MYEILCEFPGHNFVSGLRTLKPKKSLKTKKIKNLKTYFFSKNLGFSSPDAPSWQYTRNSKETMVRHIKGPFSISRLIFTGHGGYHLQWNRSPLWLFPVAFYTASVILVYIREMSVQFGLLRLARLTKFVEDSEWIA